MRHAQVVPRDAKTTTLVGDVHFRAPEVVQGMPYGSKADSWSFGVIIYYMLTQTLPFTATESETLEYRIINTEPDYEIIKNLRYPASCVNLLQKLLNKNIFQRLTMTAVGKCLWFKKARDVSAATAAVASDVQQRFKHQLTHTRKKEERDGRLHRDPLRHKSRARNERMKQYAQGPAATAAIVHQANQAAHDE